jgi:hypothetical protein
MREMTSWVCNILSEKLDKAKRSYLALCVGNENLPLVWIQTVALTSWGERYLLQLCCIASVSLLKVGYTVTRFI